MSRALPRWDRCTAKEQELVSLHKAGELSVRYMQGMCWGA